MVHSPDTLMRWHRRLVAEKWNFAHRHGVPQGQVSLLLRQRRSVRFTCTAQVNLTLFRVTLCLVVDRQCQIHFGRRLSCFFSTPRPLSSTPCVCITFFAKSMPIIVSFMSVAPSVLSGCHPTPLWHFNAVSGRGDHSITLARSPMRSIASPFCSMASLRAGATAAPRGTELLAV